MFGKKYSIDYGENKSLFIGAKEKYKAGSEVRFSVPKTPTANFHLYINGDELKPIVTGNEEYYDYEFIMPEEDLTITFQLKSNNIEVAREEEKVEVKPVMVVDYYEKPMAVVGGRGHYEMVLSTYGTDRAVLDVYDMPRADGDEIHASYEVPFSLVDEVQKTIMSSGMLDWNSRADCRGITGMLFVCKFFYAGKYVRVSSEKMPADGTAVFYAIKNLLSRRIS